MNLKKKLITSIATMSLAAALVGGATFASWTTTGTVANNTFNADTMSIVVDNSTAGTGLFPGAQKTFTFDVKNDNEFPIVVPSASISNVTWDNADGTDATGCVGNLDYVSISNPGTIAPKGKATITCTVSMPYEAGDEFQGKHAHFDLTVKADQTAVTTP